MKCDSKRKRREAASDDDEVGQSSSSSSSSSSGSSRCCCQLRPQGGKTESDRSDLAGYWAGPSGPLWTGGRVVVVDSVLGVHGQLEPLCTQKGCEHAANVSRASVTSTTASLRPGEAKLAS